MSQPLLRLGTRGSPMAIVQAELVRDRLAAIHPALAEPGALQIVVIKTTGDRVQDRPLADIGGKGLFTKEIEEALMDRRIDLAVHSVKDVPTWLPAGLELAAMLEREDPRDAFVSSVAESLAELPAGAVVGTASLRRQAQILHRWPRLQILPLRGNVNTRLRRLAEGRMDATILGAAGLRRINRLDAARRILPVEEMLPAVGQGTIGIEIRSDDARTRSFIAALDHAATSNAIRAERALLDELEGSCRTPIAGYAEVLPGDRLRLRALVALPDGSGLHELERSGPVEDAAAIGREAGLALKAVAGEAFFELLRH
jgi:hydroxymethylbilane synthase